MEADWLPKTGGGSVLHKKLQKQTETLILLTALVATDVFILAKVVALPHVTWYEILNIRNTKGSLHNNNINIQCIISSVIMSVSVWYPGLEQKWYFAPDF